jgi:hypothetical protein
MSKSFSKTFFAKLRTPEGKPRGQKWNITKYNLNLLGNIDEILIILKLSVQMWMIFGQSLNWAQMKFWWIFVALLPLRNWLSKIKIGKYLIAVRNRKLEKI